MLSSMPEGSWFGDFNAFINVTSAFTYVAHYEEDNSTEYTSDDHFRIMMLMCPVDKFLLLLKDYPQTYKWMMQRSLIRRNYFKEIQNLFYERHNVEEIFNHPRYLNKKLDEED